MRFSNLSIFGYFGIHLDMSLQVGNETKFSPFFTKDFNQHKIELREMYL